MITKLYRLAWVAGALLLSLSVFAAERLPSTLGHACAACHGTQGHSAGRSTPSLAGQSPEYFAKVMREYRDGVRPASIMGRIAKGYTDVEIDALASFFADFDWISAKQEADPALAARGKVLHETRCAACHTDSGRSARSNMPRLAGQWREYLVIALTDAQDPNRTTPTPQAMMSMMKGLGGDDLEALSHFYAAQP